MCITEVVEVKEKRWKWKGRVVCATQVAPGAWAVMLAWQKERGSTEGGVGHVGVWREGSSGCHVCITGLYFLSPQSRAGTVAASLFFFFFFLTYFDQSLLSWHPQRDILTSENSFSIFRLWPTKVGFSFLPSDREVCHLKWLVLKVCTWGLDNQVNDGKLRCVNVIVLKHVQMCRCYQANLCLAADRNSELWGSEFASKLGQARRRLRTTLFTGAENIFVAFSCA